MNKILGFILLMLLGIPVALLRGVVLSDLVDWFTPFHIGVVQAVGLFYIFTLATYGIARKQDKPKEGEEWYTPLLQNLIGSVFFSLFVWGFAYVWSLFL